MKFRPITKPLSLLYGRLARLDRVRKARNARTFDVPVVSVGGITAGGSGKTPVIRYLAGLLSDDYHVIILSRGYGRSVSERIVWTAGQPLPGPDIMGDEPNLLARSLSAGTIGIDSDRGGTLDEILRTTAFERPPLVLLDDGFQHHRLARDLDIVIVDERTVRERDLIPAGYLREPHSALERADIILVGSESGKALAVQHAGPETMVLRLETESGGVVNWISRQPKPPEGQRAVLVTGIARPERVVDSAERAGWEITSHMRYNDHRRYSEADVADILRRMTETGAELLLTTEKDAVKLERFDRLQEFLYVLTLQVDISDADLLWERIRRVASGKQTTSAG